MLDAINNSLEYEDFIYTFCVNSNGKMVFRVESKPGYDLDSDLKELFQQFCTPLVARNLMYGVSTTDTEDIHRKIVEIGTRRQAIVSN